LYYNSTLGRYVQYNEDTENSAHLTDIDNRNLQEDLERTHINNHNVLFQSKSYNSSNSNIQSNPNPNQSLVHTLMKTKLQQLRSRFDEYFTTGSRFRINGYNDENENGAEPAIIMFNHPISGRGVVSPPQQEDRGLLTSSTTTTTTATGTTANSANNRGDGERIRNIDPNIELYQPYDGRVVNVRICHCSDQNTNNNNRDAVTSNYTYYCPVYKKYCYVPIRYSKTEDSIYETYPYYYHPLCIPAPNAVTYLARNIKLIGCAALALILIVLIVSPSGHHAIRCCCVTLIPCCFHYNQKYTDYMIEHNPKLAKYYLERYMKDKDREERFNQKYIELQRLHGEADIDESATPEEYQNSGNNATGTAMTRMTKTNSDALPPLTELEESIVRDMYYYRPSLILKTRIYNESSLSHDPNQQQDTQTIPSKTADNANVGTTVALSTYDADILIQQSTESKKDVNLKNGSGNAPIKNDDGCMICFNPIQFGSKVGVLPHCQHMFHSQCLKVWLKRRNVCPLCLDTDVATVTFSRKNNHAATASIIILNDHIETPTPSIAANDSSSLSTTATEGAR
jgi:hypothetical protein